MSQQNPQPPYYNFQQHTPGPPQPQWQANPQRPGRGWGDPRPSQASPVVSSPGNAFPSQHGYGTAPSPQPFPPPPPPPPGGFPHANAPGASHHDTAGWGVKYNQNQAYAQPQDHALKPPLPPRPASGQGGGQSAWSNQIAQQNPPTPPPRPPEYATQQQQQQSHYFPHEQYSHRPPAHHYEPSTGQWPPHQPQNLGSGPAWQQPQHFDDQPVSPIEQQHQQQQAWPSSTPAPQNPNRSYIQAPSQQVHLPPASGSIPVPGASALGSGGPSDWQHFPGDEQYYHDQSHQQQHEPQNSQPFTVTPEQIHATPAYTSPGQLGPTGTYPPQGTVAAQVEQQPSAQLPQPTSHDDSSALVAGDRIRQGSDATASTSSIHKRAGTIDSVIQAWSTPGGDSVKIEPLKPASRPVSTLQQALPTLREISSIQTQTDFPPIVKTETKIETKVETREIDPYEDLKNEYRTSLNRYATMLRQERAAQTEQEKMKIVFDFVNREVKLRSVMFNAEPAELVRSSELAGLRKAAEKAKEEEVMKISSRPKDEGQVKNATHTSAKPPQINTRPTSPQHSRDDGFVVVNADGDDAEYSPGGRPRVAVPTKTPVQHRPKSPAIQTGPARKFVQPGSPSDNAPMALDDYITMEQSTAGPDRAFTATPASMQRPGSTNPSAVPSGQAQNTPAPIPFQPPRPAYTPFRYNEALDSTKPTIDASKPANEAYMRLRNEQAAESGRLLSQEPPLLTVTAPDRSHNATPSRARQQQEEAFIGLLRQQSKATNKPSHTPPPSDAPAPLRVGTPLKRRPSLPPLVKSSESLRESLPQNLAQLTFPPQSHPKVAPISSSLAKLVDDFSFIHATVVAWDKENRKHRQQLDAERADRESDNSSRVDELFHDNQIGYADIANLEEDFKLEEASKKYQEDQDELDSFTRNVFERVTQRLENEVAELETLRIKTLDVLDLGAQSASSRIRIAVSSPASALEKAPLADIMTTMLQVFNKIEVRYTKIAEAHFERERRRKRLELTVLYTNGDTAGVKKLEKDFEKAQAMQILSEARKRDERANKLMDSFDRAVVRGLAENQEWVDEMSNKGTLLRDLVLGSESNGPQGQSRQELLYGPGGIRETIDLFQEAVSMVLQDSRELVQMSSHADKILNEADFAMFIAEAKIADSSDKEFEKLRTEKTKEDQKLKDESDNRMSGVKRGPDEIFEFIRDIRNYIGNDKDFQTRINHALDAAKRRNQPHPDAGSMREV
ncbi:hypothetical protein OHC33_006344 [Knufia fluminis]|uniref:Uncharacterized protein n=1 Tax=Knufia fluminis TaxID=191047 RepID=A0AAN8F7D0_9EURO|nr:hypothetical protein OHC33_006344 [Knufia fluminis]